MLRFANSSRYWLGSLTLFLFLLTPLTAEAYVGPGARFTLVFSFFILLASFALAFLTLVTWPVRWMIKALSALKRKKRKGVKRVLIVGLDGQDPDLTEKFLEQGYLPNFRKLREEGTYSRIRTSLPAESPVAWSSFQTGCNPGKHRIYDFLVPNRKSLIPELSSAAVRPSQRTIKIGKYRIPIGRPYIRVGRKSQPFWKILGEHGIFSTVLRVPITFPPEKFKGVLLSAMCLPDVKGSQGTYFYYTSDCDEHRNLKSGNQLPLKVEAGVASGVISGPENPLLENGNELSLQFKLHLGDAESDSVDLIIEKERHTIRIGQYSPWLRIRFRLGLGMSVQGICRILPLEKTPHVRLYITPIQIDPERPALPISYPFVYATYLSKLIGPFATLGVAEDTSGLNEGVISEEAFLEQCWSIHSERESMLFDALEKTPRGCVVCVFDITDRIQHMFFRYIEEHSSSKEEAKVPDYSHVIRDLYKRMDELVGQVMNEIGNDTILIVLSDHGFKPFRRGVNLNTWLKEHGYLKLREGANSTDMLNYVNWSETRAYAVGFGGIYLNLKGREDRGIVQSGVEAKALKKEIAQKLLSLRDNGEDQIPIKQVFDGKEVYKGPYVDEAPDLIVGCSPGYRVAWDSVTGGIGELVIEDNTRPWSGDHNMNPSDVPGIFFCNRLVRADESDIMDIAPTILELFGVPVPAYFDGKTLLPRKSH